MYTWFTMDTPQSVLLDVAPPGYAGLHVVRSTGAGRPSRGGGLAVLFRESVPVRVHHLANKFQPMTLTEFRRSSSLTRGPVVFAAPKFMGDYPLVVIFVSVSHSMVQFYVGILVKTVC